MQQRQYLDKVVVHVVVGVEEAVKVVVTEAEMDEVAEGTMKLPIKNHSPKKKLYSDPNYVLRFLVCMTRCKK